MQETDAMLQGWDFCTKNVDTAFSAKLGEKYYEKYEEEIKEAIKNFNTGINSHSKKLPEPSLAGNMAEEYYAGTFNYNAIRHGSKLKLIVDKENRKNFGSPDLVLMDGNEKKKQFSVKHCETAEKSIEGQATLTRDGTTPKYIEQDFIIPQDQVEEGRKIASRRAGKNLKAKRAVKAQAYKNVSENVSGKVVVRKGVSSDGLSYKQGIELAQKREKGKIKVEKLGYTVEKSVTTEYVMKQAAKAGISAAAVTVAMQLTPEFMKAINYLIETGQIDSEQFRQAGGKALGSGAESFLRGTVASALTVMCKNSIFGQALVHATPSLIGTMVAVTLETAKNSIMVASGKMTMEEMEVAITDNMLISACCLGATALGFQIGGSIGSVLPGIGTLIGTVIGSLLGCTVAIVHNISKKSFISFCVDSGFTCFGLVEQNYQLPPEVLEKLGVETVAVPKTEIKTNNISTVAINKVNVSRIQPETVELLFVRRGVIGVNKIGYVF